MISQHLKPPSTERSFATAWGELDYLCRKIHFWLYARQRRSQAAHFAARLQQVIEQLPANDTAILRQDGLALLAELQGDIPQAIKHRRREIELTRRLQQEAAKPRYDEATRTYMLQGRDELALAARQTILASLLNRQTSAKAGGRGTAPALST